MNDINSFTFYSNYYELIDNLDRENKLIMLEAIVDYVFKDKEPELTGMNKAIWTNIVLPITKSKNNSKRSQNHNQKETEKKPKGNQKETNNISYFYFLISNFILDNNYSNNLKLTLEEWVNYKFERKEGYKETGFTKLLSQIKNSIEKYSEERMIEVINSSMASNYKGIVFDWLGKGQAPVGKRKEPTPEWYGKDIEAKELTEAEQRAFEERLKTLR